MKSQLFVAALVASALLPATAQAHHVEGNADCTKVTAKFIGFNYSETPAIYSVSIDGQTVVRNKTPLFSGNYYLLVPINVPPGRHTVQFSATWPKYNSGKFTEYVDCPVPPEPEPTPVPPETVPTPEPTPPEQPPVPVAPPVEPPPVTPPVEPTCPPRAGINAHIERRGNFYVLTGKFLSRFRWFVDGELVSKERSVKKRFTRGGHALVVKARWRECRKVNRDRRLPQPPPPDTPRFAG